jgi:hypothetical protein
MYRLSRNGDCYHALSESEMSCLQRVWICQTWLHLVACSIGCGDVSFGDEGNETAAIGHLWIGWRTIPWIDLPSDHTGGSWMSSVLRLIIARWSWAVSCAVVSLEGILKG